MKYRDHRGGLKESMETVIEVHNVQEIIDHLNRIYESTGMIVEEVKFGANIFDERTGWDTYYVLQRFKGEDKFTVAGCSDGCF